MQTTETARALLADGALGVDEAAAFARVSRAELYRWMQRGELAYVLRGRRRLVPRRALVDLLARGLRGGDSYTSA